MVKCFSNMIFALVITMVSAFPAIAEVTHTKTALVKMITKETRNTGVKHRDIVRMVNAAFKEGKRHGVSAFLIISVMNTESKFRPWAKNKSGASGLMQIIPRWHMDKIKGRNIHRIETNIEVGTTVLADCLRRHDGLIKSALRCYSGNARNYTAKIKTGYKQAKAADVIYRFKYNLPLVVLARFEEPNSFSITSTTQISN